MIIRLISAGPPTPALGHGPFLGVPDCRQLPSTYMLLAVATKQLSKGGGGTCGSSSQSSQPSLLSQLSQLSLCSSCQASPKLMCVSFPFPAFPYGPRLPMWPFLLHTPYSSSSFPKRCPPLPITTPFPIPIPLHITSPSFASNLRGSSRTGPRLGHALYALYALLVPTYHRLPFFLHPSLRNSLRETPLHPERILSPHINHRSWADTYILTTSTYIQVL
ncbi:hypothetical protein F5B20DRAFT_311219 [Whalleya microplaca]|nr:hypothetical protein F5B20DRAFT_311219 [Whalleya microplaca]